MQAVSRAQSLEEVADAHAHFLQAALHASLCKPEPACRVVADAVAALLELALQYATATTHTVSAHVVTSSRHSWHQMSFEGCCLGKGIHIRVFSQHITALASVKHRQDFDSIQFAGKIDDEGNAIGSSELSYFGNGKQYSPDPAAVMVFSNAVRVLHTVVWGVCSRAVGSC